MCQLGHHMNFLKKHSASYILLEIDIKLAEWKKGLSDRNTISSSLLVVFGAILKGLIFSYSSSINLIQNTLANSQ